MKKEFDVAIVGAGPAGNSAAKILAEKGFTVALVEKEKLPRNKICSGLISKRCIPSLNKLDVDINHLSLQSYKGFIIRFKDLSYEYQWDKECVWGVNRKDFDYFLTRKSLDSGVQLINDRVLNFSIEKDSIITVIKKGNIKSSVLLGADGANSRIRKCLGIKYDKRKIGVGVAAEIKQNKKNIDKMRSLITVDYSYLNEGFSYIIPKIKANNVHISMGAYAEYVKKIKYS